jgi:shikimate dehydrogenase
MDRYAVIGNPVEHSRSPRIHQLFARQAGQALRYEKLLAPFDDFAGTLRRFQAEGGRGANVTLPFKLEALALCDQVSERARRAGAANTLSLGADGQIRGDNTDGAGLLRDLRANLGLDLAGMQVLLLGAGGAVRGVLQPLLDAAPAAVCIANRTAARALALAEEFAGTVPIEGGSYGAFEGRVFDLVINGTSSGLAGEVPPLPDEILKPGGVCYDMLYGDAPTPFLRWAAAHGAGVTTDGLGMLVEQAAESFFIWRGVRPDTRPVLKALRAD